MTTRSNRRIRIGEFVVDLANETLLKSGRTIRLQAQPFRILKFLLDHPGEVVTREQLRREIWSDEIYVDFDRSLNTAVARIREALGDSPNRPAYIETIPRRGYRFIASVTADSTQTDNSPLNSDNPEPGERKRNSWSGLRKMALAGTSVSIVLAVLWATRTDDTPQKLPLNPRPLTYYEGVESEPGFSPDGNQVVFTWNGESQDNFDIYVKTVDGPRLVRLTHHPSRDFSPAWSPDGQWIAFLRKTADGRDAVYRIPALGGREERLLEVAASPISAGTQSVNSRYLSWSPDSDSLVVVDRRSPTEDLSLFLLSPSTGRKRRLTSAPGGGIGDRSPSFSPDLCTQPASRESVALG